MELPPNGLTLPHFQYITKSLVFDKAPVCPRLKMLGADVRCGGCSMDCLDVQGSCECAGESYGQHAYTKDGLLKADFLEKVLFHPIDLIQTIVIGKCSAICLVHV